MPLPEATDKLLLANANAKCREGIDQVREILGGAAIGGIDYLAGAFRGQAWTQLVHNSYVDNPDIRELLALHIESTKDEFILDETELGRWVRDFKQGVKENVLDKLA